MSLSSWNRKRVILISSLLMIAIVLTLAVFKDKMIAYAQGGRAIYRQDVYASYRFNTLKQPTGLLGLTLRNGGFNLFIADSGNHVIRQFRPASGSYPGALLTIAGTGSAGYVNGYPLDAKFNYPTGLEGRNYTWVECEYDYRDTSGNPQIGNTTFPPIQTDPVGNANPPNLEIESLPLPNPVPLGYTGYRRCYYHNYQNLHINDSQNFVLRKAVVGDVPYDQNEEVTTLAGSHYKGHADGQGDSVYFASLAGHTDVGDTCYMVDAENHCIRTMGINNTVSTFAGSSYSGFVDGYRTDARFFVPGKIGADSAGNMMVADIGNNAIRKIDPAGWVTTVGGAGPMEFGYADGQGSNAKFFRPTAIVFNPTDGMWYVADSHNNCIRRIDASGNVTTYTGAPEGGYVDGSLAEARFRGPADIVIRNGFMYISDSMNNCIRRIDMNAGIVTTYIS